MGWAHAETRSWLWGPLRRGEIPTAPVSRREVPELRIPGEQGFGRTRCRRFGVLDKSG